MNKKINIEKKIMFSKNIGEITAISLEHDLVFLSSDSIEGNLIVSGKYRSMLVAEMEESFNYKIPVEISLTDSLNLDTSKVGINDFNYSIVDDKYLLCKIELSVEGEIIETLRECDGNSENNNDDIPRIDQLNNSEIIINNSISNNVIESDDNNIQNIVSNKNIIDNENISTNVTENNEDDENKSDEDDKNNESLNDKFLFNIDTDKETFGTFIVYIVRENETINTIISKYNTSIEEIEKYNDLGNLSAGDKIIVPLLSNDNK